MESKSGLNICPWVIRVGELKRDQNTKYLFSFNDGSKQKAGVYEEYLFRKLESVQRRATKSIPGFRNLSYQQRLTKLKLPTLSHRRKRGDMIDVFKYLMGLYDTHKPLFVINGLGKTRGHTMKLQKQYARLDVRKHFFSNRVVELWNSLPENVISATSVNSFKNRLDKYWSNNLSLLYEPV